MSVLDQEPVIKIRDLIKTYGEGTAEVQVLKGVDIDVGRHEIVALCGPSGSGKSTLLNIIGCLDKPSSGTYLLEGEDVANYDRGAQANVRLRKLGFVFQSFHLLSDQTAIENVMLPLQYAGVPVKERQGRAAEALARVELQDRMDHRPNQLSGGQKQRVAIARSLVTEPSLLLADEPTGALDSRTGKSVLQLLEQLHEERGLTVVMVTHDVEVAAWAHRRIALLDGKISA
ncbi:MAG: ABC transporter ATP-binding protein [Myxococcales bacterium]|nr:ABC transporter ATP-binding protein [Myxococcales bacterium]